MYATQYCYDAISLKNHWNTTPQLLPRRGHPDDTWQTPDVVTIMCQHPT